MSKTKHTPGPWRASLKSKDSVRIETDDNFNGYVATVGADDTEERNGTIYEFVSKTGRANARLIAAAPELLEALKIVVTQLGEYKDGDGAAKYHALNIARAAITKAEGGEK